ncbi:MAG: DUF4157 domain-containing protein, partial [Lachnospiraceae bacterium]|nr:DUF4157 domain-containing protein [Lachnospiraceae bacterium]
ILSSHDPASRGLVAHELAHTMQQGIVAGDVAESAPAGAEQGGVLDWIRNALNKRSVKKARSSAMKKVKPVGENKMNPEQVDQLNAMMGPAVEKSNEAWDLASNESDAYRLSQGYQGLRLRDSSNEEAKMNNQIMAQVFNGSEDAYGAYYESLANSGVDFQKMISKKDEYITDEGKKVLSNDSVSGIAQDIYSIAGNYMMSDTGLDYIENMMNNIQDAKMFQESGTSPINFILTTMMTSEMGRMAKSITAAENGMNNPKDKNKASRMQLRSMLYSNLLQPMAMERLTDEDRAKIPSSIQSLYAQYVSIRKRIQEALDARKLAAGKATA